MTQLLQAQQHLLGRNILTRRRSLNGNSPLLKVGVRNVHTVFLGCLVREPGDWALEALVEGIVAMVKCELTSK